MEKTRPSRRVLQGRQLAAYRINIVRLMPGSGHFLYFPLVTFFFLVFILSFIASADIADFQIAFFNFFVKLTINCDLLAPRYMQVSEYFCWMSVCLSDCLTIYDCALLWTKKNYFCVFDMYSSLLCYLRNCRL